MGSKGSTPQTTVQQQQYTPSPYIAGGGQAAIQGAEFAAQQPFQQPVQPLAPFSPFQNQAMQGVGQAVGMAQPYFGAGAGYLAGSAAPITGQDVAGYYNPMASSVMAGMQDIFGQQMRDITGKLTQAAGGVGADRIAVGQSELARQQGLAGGQTLAGLYYPALQAAQQQKQMMAGAGYGLGQFGPAAQQAQLQGLQAQMSAGGMQQQLAQQYLNNLYANRMAQIGYPFQTAQYLAGITGGLAPAMGGFTAGLGQQYAPQPSALAQGLGLGTSLIGGIGSVGGFGGMKGSGGGPTNLAFDTSGLGGGNTFSYTPFMGNRGGRVYARGGRTYAPTHMKGGGAPPTTLPKAPDPIYSPKSLTQEGTSTLPVGGISTEDALAQADPYFQWYGGVPAVNRAQIAAMTTPAQRPSTPATSESLPMSSRPFSMAETSGPMGASGLTKSPDLFTQWMQRLKQQDNSTEMGTKLAADMGTQLAANGGAIGSSDPFDTADSPVPKISLQPGAGHSGLGFGHDMDMKMASAPSGGGSSGKGSTASEVGTAAQIAMDVLPMLMVARGGAIGSENIGEGFQMGGMPQIGGGMQMPGGGQNFNPQSLMALLQQRFSQLPNNPFQGGSGKGANASPLGGLGGFNRFGPALGGRQFARGGNIRGYQEGGDIADFPFTPQPDTTPPPPPDYGGYATSQEQEMARQAQMRELGSVDRFPTPSMLRVPGTQAPAGDVPPLSQAVTAPPMGATPSMPEPTPTPTPAPDYSSQPPLEAGYPQQPEPVSGVPMPMERPTEAHLTDPSASLPDVYQAAHENLSKDYGRKAASAVLGNLGVESPTLNPMESHDQGTGVGIAGWRLERRDALYDFASKQGLNPNDRRTQLAFLKHEINTNPQYADMMKRMQNAGSPAEAARIFRTEFERPAGTPQGRPLGLGQAQELASRFAAGDFDVKGVSRAAEGPMGATGLRPGLTAADYMMPSERLPYPDATQRDWGQRAIRSPWMSLVMAGAKMASTPGPIGSVIGKGIEAGVGALEGQRKDLRSEEDINLKADKLWQEAQTHLDRYTKMTPYEQARLEQERYQWQPGTGLDPNTGEKVPGAWRLPTRSGEQPQFIPGAEITGKGGTRDTALLRNINGLVAMGLAPDKETAYRMVSRSARDPMMFASLVQREKKYLRDQNPAMPDSQLQRQAEDNIREAQQRAQMYTTGQQAAPAATHAGTATDPIPYTEGVKRKSGLVYSVPGQDKPQRWTGPDE